MGCCRSLVYHVNNSSCPILQASPTAIHTLPNCYFISKFPFPWIPTFHLVDVKKTPTTMHHHLWVWVCLPIIFYTLSQYSMCFTALSILPVFLTLYHRFGLLLDSGRWCEIVLNRNIPGKIATRNRFYLSNTINKEICRQMLLSVVAFHLRMRYFALQRNFNLFKRQISSMRASQKIQSKRIRNENAIEFCLMTICSTSMLMAFFIGKTNFP